MLGGGDPFYVKFWVNRLPLERNRRFKPMFAGSSSAVTPSEKSSINTNRKSIYYALSNEPRMIVVCPCPPGGGGSKTQNDRLPCKIAFRL